MTVVAAPWLGLLNLSLFVAFFTAFRTFGFEALAAVPRGGFKPLLISLLRIVTAPI
jgi:hypothetical protein